MKYIDFKLNNRIAIAVSGGRDSMSLAIHTKYRYPSKEIVAIILNHQLRTESYDESIFAQSELENHGIKSYILKWNNSLCSQTHARIARYNIITAKCYELNIDTLMTAHHLDDVIETYIMRDQRQSGTRGLASIHAVNYINGIRILRPLIQNWKSDIIPLSKWVNDSSNENTQFTRVRIRQQILNGKYDKSKIIDQIRIFSYQRYKIDIEIIKLFLDNMKINNNNIIFSKNIINDHQVLKVAIEKILFFLSGKYTILKDFNISHQYQNLGMCILKNDGKNIIISKHKKNWIIKDTDNNWILSPCYDFLIKGKNIILDYLLANHPLGGQYIKLHTQELFPIWYHYLK